jgi:hypothetical protein
MRTRKRTLVAGWAVLLVCGVAAVPLRGERDNAPPAVALTQRLQSTSENSQMERQKAADIVVTDDGEGANALSLSGPDAALFEIVGTILYLRQGAVVDFETNPVLDVTVAVTDAV